jgi:ATP-dependent RNA helicase DDX54/DBP10
VQTKAYVDKVACYTDLRSTVLVGGESIQEQFTELLKNPDVLVATPGRLLQLVDEMAEIRGRGSASTQSEGPHSFFKNVQYVIFDEADVLFEMGLAPQVYALLTKLPADRLTALFSATLPKSIIELARIGLKDPVLIRLDVEAQLPPTLDTIFLACQPGDKEATLVALLTNPLSPLCIKETENVSESSRVSEAAFGGLVFVATRHHVDYLHELFTALSLPHGSLYGTMDAEARTEALRAFKQKAFPLLLVTDVAARGLDLPHLKWICHYDFPPQEKLFVHRAGRVARAGRQGTAVSLVTSDDLPYLYDLASFLDKDVVAEVEQLGGGAFRIGCLPKSLLDDALEKTTGLLQHDIAVSNLKRVTQNALKLYHKTRPSASKAAYERSKALLHRNHGLFPLHPLWVNSGEDRGQDVSLVLNQLKHWKPVQTIFEAMAKNTKGEQADPAAVLLAKRRLTFEKKYQQAEVNLNQSLSSSAVRHLDDKVDEAELAKVFRIESRKNAESFFLPYEPSGKAVEDGLRLNKTGSANFLKEANQAAFDIAPQQPHTTQQQQSGSRMVWDKKHKKYIKRFSNQLKPEIGSSFVSSQARLQDGQKRKAVGELYQEWQKKFKRALPSVGQEEISGQQLKDLEASKKMDYRGKKKHKKPGKQEASHDKSVRKVAVPTRRPAAPRNELKSADQVVKARRQKAKEANRLSAKRVNRKKK